MNQGLTLFDSEPVYQPRTIRDAIGDPLSISNIESLSGLSSIFPEIEWLLEKGYLKEIAGKYDLKGAMFCSGLFKRPRWDEPSPTILTNFYNPRYFCERHSRSAARAEVASAV